MDLRYQTKVTLWLLIAFVVLAVGGTLYDGIAEGNWFKDFGSSFAGCTLCAWMYSNAKTRLAALEVMDGRQPESAQAAVAAEAWSPPTGRQPSPDVSMKESGYFQKAFQDADYRQAKTTELRHQARYTLGFLIFGVVLLVAMTLARGLGEGLWWEGLTGMFPSVILMAWVHTHTRTRLAALEAMEGKAAEPVVNALERNAT